MNQNSTICGPKINKASLQDECVLQTDVTSISCLTFLKLFIAKKKQNKKPGPVQLCD